MKKFNDPPRNYQDINAQRNIRSEGNESSIPNSTYNHISFSGTNLSSDHGITMSDISNLDSYSSRLAPITALNNDTKQQLRTHCSDDGKDYYKKRTYEQFFRLGFLQPGDLPPANISLSRPATVNDPLQNKVRNSAVFSHFTSTTQNRSRILQGGQNAEDQTMESSFEIQSASSVPTETLQSSICEEELTKHDTSFPENTTMTLESISEDMVGPKRIDIVVENLFMTSDFFLQKAHKIVLNIYSEQGMNEYFKMIKISIKSLVIIARKYAQHLTPRKELILYYKLARLFLFETENIDKADENIYKSGTIAKRNKFTDLIFVSDYLSAQIKERNNKTVFVNFINERVTYYENLELHHYVTMLQLLKIELLLTYDANTAVIILQSLAQLEKIDELTKVHCMLSLSNLHLYRGSPSISLSIVNEIDKILDSLGNETPRQMAAMSAITRYYGEIQMNNVDEASKIMKSINSLIANEQNLSWSSWREDGKFKIEIPIQPEANTLIPTYLSWLNSDEFVIMFYFLTGIHYMSEAANGKKKSKKVFDRCLQIVEKQLLELGLVNNKRNLSITDLSNKIIRLKFIKYSTKIYQAWIGFLNGEFKDINYLNEFMLDYNNRRFSDEEFCEYSLLLPKTYYLFALYYHYKGDIQAAKYYYLKVKNLTSEFNSAANSDVVSSNCSVVGLGNVAMVPKLEFSELYVFSSVHLLVLVQFELLQLMKQAPGQSTDAINDCFKLCNRLHNELNGAFGDRSTSNSFTSNFAKCNDLLKMTHSILVNISDEEQQNSTFLQELSQVYNKYELKVCFPFVFNVVKHLLFVLTTSLEEKNKYLSEFLTLILIPAKTDFERIVFTFILKSLLLHFKSTGENDKANMVELQLQYIHKSLEDKYRFVLSNIAATV